MRAGISPHPYKRSADRAPAIFPGRAPGLLPRRLAGPAEGGVGGDGEGDGPGEGGEAAEVRGREALARRSVKEVPNDRQCPGVPSSPGRKRKIGYGPRALTRSFGRVSTSLSADPVTYSHPPGPKPSPSGQRMRLSLTSVSRPPFGESRTIAECSTSVK